MRRPAGSEQADGHRQQEVHGRSTGAAQRRIEHQADGDRQYADESAEHGLRHETCRGRDWRRHGNRDFMIESGAGVGDEGDLVRLAEHPWERQADPCGLAALDRAGRRLRELPIGGVDLNLRDRHRLRTAGAHQQAKPVLVEDGALDRQVLDRRRAIVEARKRIGGKQPCEREAEDRQRDEKPEQEIERSRRRRRNARLRRPRARAAECSRRS